MASRTFTAAKAAADTDPIIVELESADGKVSERFAFPRKLPTFTLLEMMSNVGDVQDPGNEDPRAGVEAVAALFRFLDDCLGKADGRRFRDTMRELRMEEDRLIEILGYVSEEATGRPFVAGASSPAPPSRAGRRSTAASSKRGRTSKRSTRAAS